MQHKTKHNAKPKRHSPKLSYKAKPNQTQRDTNQKPARLHGKTEQVADPPLWSLQETADSQEDQQTETVVTVYKPRRYTALDGQEWRHQKFLHQDGGSGRCAHHHHPTEEWQDQGQWTDLLGAQRLFLRLSWGTQEPWPQHLSLQAEIKMTGLRLNNGWH